MDISGVEKGRKFINQHVQYMRGDRFAPAHHRTPRHYGPSAAAEH